MKKILLSTTLLLLSFVTALTAVFAWLPEQKSIDPQISSEILYLGSGGTVGETQHKLTAPIHVYYLAWLWAAEDIDSSHEIVIWQNIDMGGMEIPPLGTSQKPFNGTIELGEYKITNFTVKTEFADSEVPSGILAKYKNREITFMSPNSGQAEGYADNDFIYKTESPTS